MVYIPKSQSDETIESLAFVHELGKNEIQRHNIKGHETLIAPVGTKAISLEEFEPAPYRIKRHQKFTDAESLKAYIERFNSDPILLTASIASRNVTATFDYPEVGKPAWGDHRAELVSICTPEWQAFKSVNEKWLSQTEFAEFLDMWNHIVIEPTSAHISEVALNLEGSVGTKFASKINRHDGSATLSYEEDVTTNKVKVPTKFIIAAQPFFHSERVDVLVHLRFRVNDGTPKFQIVIPNVARIEYDSLELLWKNVCGITGLPVLVGP